MLSRDTIPYLSYYSFVLFRVNWVRHSNGMDDEMVYRIERERERERERDRYPIADRLEQQQGAGSRMLLVFLFLSLSLDATDAE